MNDNDLKVKFCPECGPNIIMEKINIKDVIIDVCPNCKGIYYDKGEMKKILPNALDSDTILSRLTSDSSHLVCPVCEINMEKISAQKGNLYYEMHFCRSCLAIFLSHRELVRIIETLKSTTFRRPSAFRPKTVFETKYNYPTTNVETSYTKVDKQPTLNVTLEQERNALEHYQRINYDYMSEHEPISALNYLFCLFTNMPIEVYNPRYYFPFALVILLLINTFVFALSYKLAFNVYTSDSIDRSVKLIKHFYNVIGLIPAEFFSFKWLLNLLSYQFAHSDLIHFAVNMYFLWVFGDNVCDIFYDNKEPIYREVSFFAFYLICGVIGGIAHQIVYYGSEIPLVGASGAVAAMMGAYLRLFPNAKFYQVIFFYPFKIPVIFYVGFWVIGQMMIGITLGSKSMVSWPAHLGGFIAGFTLIQNFIPYAPEEVSANVNTNYNNIQMKG